MFCNMKQTGLQMSNRGYNLLIIINVLFNHGQMLLIMPRLRKSIFSRLFHMGYRFVASISSWYLVKFVALYLNPKFRLSVKNATSAQKKRESIECLFARLRIVTPKIHA